MDELNKVQAEIRVSNFQPEAPDEGGFTDYTIPGHQESEKTEDKPVVAKKETPQDPVEKDLEGKVLTKEFIDSYAKDYLTNLTKRSHVGPAEFLVYKHIGRNVLYFLKRINPEEKKAKYKFQMYVPAAGNSSP